MSGIELKPCPFCGGTFVGQGASRDQISVWCRCGAQGPSVPFPEINPEPSIAIQQCFAAWNRLAAVPSEQEPVAADFMALAAHLARTNAGRPTIERASDGVVFVSRDVAIEAMQSLLARDARPAPAAGVKVKPPKWHHEVAIGASTPEEWFATTPEGQSLTVTYDESCELPWVARPFPPGPSNYATADEAKAALEAAREARIRRALDTGEPK